MIDDSLESLSCLNNTDSQKENFNAMFEAFDNTITNDISVIGENMDELNISIATTPINEEEIDDSMLIFDENANMSPPKNVSKTQTTVYNDENEDSDSVIILDDNSNSVTMFDDVEKSAATSNDTINISPNADMKDVKFTFHLNHFKVVEYDNKMDVL